MRGIMHEEARDVWKAWADGVAVQFQKDDGSWKVMDPPDLVQRKQPHISPGRWRIKPETTTACITYKVAVMNFGEEGVQLLLYGPESYECAEESDSFICWDTEERIVEVEVQV